MPQFSFFADAYLAKSGNKTEPFKVGGILTTEDRDIDGEIVKAIDWNYFTGGFGKIKYEHHDIKEPDCFVGFPTKLFKSGKAWHFEGELIPFDPDMPETKLTPQQKLAKSMVSLLQHIEDFNTRHKGTSQKAGWSIEGEYLSKDPNGLVKARAVNVVFTTKPRNTNTLATLLKSLDMGYGMEPETQTGFAAFRKESLEGNTKINDGYSNNKSQNNKGESKMFKTFEEIYKSCKDKGMKHEEALAEAKKQMAAKNKAVDEDFEKAEKSLGSSKEKLEKSLAALTDLSKIEFDVDVEQHRARMEKSIKTLQNAEDGEVDLGAFFKTQNEVLMNVLKSQTIINQKVDLLAKSISLTNEAAKEAIENDSFVRNATADLRGELQQLEKSIGVFVKSIRNAEPAKTNLEDLQVAEDGKKQMQKINKSVMTNALMELSKSGDIDENTVIKFETTNQISDSAIALLKSKKPDLFK